MESTGTQWFENLGTLATQKWIRIVTSQLRNTEVVEFNLDA